MKQDTDPYTGSNIRCHFV